jgi:hypothetical protein
MMDFIKDRLLDVLKSLAIAVLAALAVMGYWFCSLLGVNAIYCEPLLMRSELFLIAGVLLSLFWRRISTLLVSVALLVAVGLPIISRLVPLPRSPEEIVEFGLVAPLQVAIGVIIGQILIWIWTQFGPILIEWLRNGFGGTTTP